MRFKDFVCEGVEFTLVEVKNADGEVVGYSSAIQAYPFGEYQHPRHGKLVMNDKIANEFALGINQRVTTSQLYIDFDHVEGPAAGWITGAEVDGEGLNLSVNWTKSGVKAIKSQEYKYFSPYYARKWKHPKTGIVHKNVMLGGGLVNRPFLKDINPVALGDTMDWEAFLKEALGDKADSVIQSISTTLSEQTNEKITGLTQVFEQKLEEQNQLIVTLIQEKKKTDINLHVGKWGKTLPVALHDPIKEVMTLADAETTTSFIKFMDELSKLGSISPEGNSGAGDPIKNSAETDPIDSGNGVALSDHVTKMMGQNPALSYSEAAQKVLSNNPELMEEYRSTARSLS